MGNGAKHNDQAPGLSSPDMKSEAYAITSLEGALRDGM